MQSPPKIELDSQHLDKFQQGKYDFSDRSVHLPSYKDLERKIDLRIIDVEERDFELKNNERGKRLYKNAKAYWQGLKWDLDKRKKRWHSIAAHELAHDYFENMLSRYPKIYQILLDWNEKGFNREYNAVAEKFTILRNLVELDGSISEMRDIRDLGAIYNIVIDFYYKFLAESKYQKLRIDNLVKGEEIAGDYNLAAYWFLLGKIDFEGNNNPNIIAELENAIDLLNEDPEAFMRDRLNKFNTEDLLRQAEKVIEEILEH